MLIQKKFKRLKVNAGFTLGLNTALCRKENEKEYRVLGTGNVYPIKGSAEVWVDSFQVKPWWKL